MDAADLIGLILELRARGEPGALATITRTRGHCPREVGAKMLVLRDGRTFGTVGGGCGEAEVRRQALAVIDSGRPVVHVVNLLDDPARPDGAACGGRMELFIEPIAPGPPVAPGPPEGR